MNRITHWIGGRYHPDQAARSGQVYDPALGRVSGLVDLASAADVDVAVEVAGQAWRQWRDSSLTTRSKILFAFREQLDKRKEELAEIITAEHGKVLSDALGEVHRGLEVAEFACGIPQLLKGEYSSSVSTDVDVHSLRQSLGVVAVISPFNFPVMVPLWFVPLAIACGNSVVLKPSEKDPSAANLLAEIWHDAGLPAGVFNVVHGDREAVDALLQHPDVAAVSFVGSTPVAEYVYAKATSRGKRAQALGGAKNHMIALPDADPDLVADAAVSAGFGSAGERCMAISVLVAVGSAHETVVPKIVERMRGLRVGDGRTGADMGPMVTEEHLKKVVSYVEAGVREGADLLVDGRGIEVDADRDGYWLGPTLFDNVEPHMTIYRDEIFGPVLSVVRVPDFQTALRLVNDNPYGNGTAIFTNDGRSARRFQEEVSVGMVGINVPIPVPMAYYSFGGWKSSLFGDNHAYGAEGIHFYTRNKVVTSRWPDHGPTGVDLGFPQNA